MARITTPTPRPATNGRTAAGSAWVGHDQGDDAGGDRPRTAARPPRPAAPTYTLTSRKPTGVCPYPLVLVEGPEYTGKSTLAVELANDGRVGETWMMHLGEEVDWLGAVADFNIVEHNGEWWQLLAATQQLHTRFTEQREAGEPTPLLIVDGDTAIWSLLSTWAENRARTSDDAQRRLMTDPNAEIPIGHTYWNAATRRHRQLVALWRSMPAIVVVTARGKWVSAFDKATGAPIPKTREYSVQCHAELPYASTAWVRLATDEYPQVYGARTPRGGIRPGQDDPVVVDPRFASRFPGLRDQGGFNLGWLVFDVLGFSPDMAAPGRVVEPVADAGADDGTPDRPARPVLDGADEFPGAQPAEVVHPAE